MRMTGMARAMRITASRMSAPALALAVLIALACGGGDAAPDAPPADGAPDVLQILMASTDLAVGENRVAFGLLRPGEGALKNADVELQTFFLADGERTAPVQTLSPEFRPWPGGAGGAYIANAVFDRPGEWGLRVEVSAADGSSLLAGSRVDVAETGATPAIGAPAPRSANKTAAAASSLAQITSDMSPDADLYRKTIADALDEARPLLVAFATPAYCRTATCGPQLDAVKSLKNRHAERMSFIHVEIYDNPDEIRQNGISAARTSPIVEEWGLPSEPWTFVIDANGAIAAKFEGFADEDELDAAIREVLSR